MGIWRITVYGIKLKTAYWELMLVTARGDNPWVAVKIDVAAGGTMPNFAIINTETAESRAYIVPYCRKRRQINMYYDRKQESGGRYIYRRYGGHN